MTHLAFIDTETTGLDIDKHQIWELALIIRDHPTDHNYNGEWLFQFPVSLDAASPEALKMTDFINRYQCWHNHARMISHPKTVAYWAEIEEEISVLDENGKAVRRRKVTEEDINGRTIIDPFQYPSPKVLLLFIRELISGAHLVGAVTDFDAYRLAQLFEDNDLTRYVLWHYHLIDIENLAVGYARGFAEGVAEYGGRFRKGDELTLPWKSDDLSRIIGVEPPSDEERHTALGDARWAERVYDKVLG